MKMIELKEGLYIVLGDRYKVVPKDSTKVVLGGRKVTSRETRGDRHPVYDLTGVVKEVEEGRLLLSPATRRSTYAVDLGHVYEITTELEEVRIDVKNIEDIVRVGERKNGTNLN